MTLLALAGGVGGAKLAHGLAQKNPGALTVIVNTADDFRHLGLHISPDIDTVLYTLAGFANRAQGWGIEGESWAFLDQLERMGGPAWFRLGDRDLALHVLRTMRLAGGESLTAIVRDFAARLGIASTVLPMSDDPVQTVVLTAAGELPFQDYFVRLRCEVEVTGFRFDGIEAARPTGSVIAAVADPDLAAILICPSNPYVSVAPILGVAGMRALLAGSRAPIVAVSPIIAGSALKGPAAKMMHELRHDASALGVARQYAGLIDGFVIDDADAELRQAIEALGMRVHLTDAVMHDEPDRARLAEECVQFAAGLTR